MSENGKPTKTDRRRYSFNMLLAGAAGSAGCVTVIILFLALFAGLWLDNLLGSEKHLYTIFALVFSVPLTLVAMLWIVRVTTSRIKSSRIVEDESEKVTEEANRA